VLEVLASNIGKQEIQEFRAFNIPSSKSKASNIDADLNAGRIKGLPIEDA